ncbi:Replication factor C, subunit RFC4 [Malassezia vespertilionis]|uniref:Replication factor C, subunit RFC4 n=1 Tax=Malassezia vespertilionis TaxID=2020962 RepID=UPI0024B0B2CE|nr:Replication factor C, subunit RFC4 [Malassezia vespertilionis]WFD04706.1 Replication factor C, subunit RFC4 [Malassezia vespertilionis]
MSGSVDAHINHQEVSPKAMRAVRYETTKEAAAKGFAIGMGGTTLIGYFLQTYSPTIRKMPRSLKLTTTILGGMALGSVFGERASIAFEQMHYADNASKHAQRVKQKHETDWDSLPLYDKALSWTKNNKFTVVIGSWIGSMAGSWLYIQSQPLSFSQKLVQTRVWAQGLTIVSLIGMASLTHLPSAGDKLLEEEKLAEEHSWSDIILEQNHLNNQEHPIILHHSPEKKGNEKGKMQEDDNKKEEGDKKEAEKE